jgi:hypothetical protein
MNLLERLASMNLIELLTALGLFLLVVGVGCLFSGAAPNAYGQSVSEHSAIAVAVLILLAGLACLGLAWLINCFDHLAVSWGWEKGDGLMILCYLGGGLATLVGRLLVQYDRWKEKK